MTVAPDRPWPLALLRGLLCVVLTLAFTTSALGELDTHIECVKHDRVSDGGQGSPTSWFGRGMPRIVKRLVGIDHLAINAVVPDQVFASSERWEPGEVEPLEQRSFARYRGAPVRGPPLG